MSNVERGWIKCGYSLSRLLLTAAAAERRERVHDSVNDGSVQHCCCAKEREEKKLKVMMMKWSDGW